MFFTFEVKRGICNLCDWRRDVADGSQQILSDDSGPVVSAGLRQQKLLAEIEN